MNCKLARNEPFDVSLEGALHRIFNCLGERDFGTFWRIGERAKKCAVGGHQIGRHDCNRIFRQRHIESPSVEAVSLPLLTGESIAPKPTERAA